jgi:hypothetical protein
MTARNLQNLISELESNGFAAREGNRFRLEPLSAKGANRQELPWQILDWEIEDRSGDIHQERFAVRLNAELFLQNFEDQLKERFPAFRKVALEDDKKGGFWLLIEFLDRDMDADQSRLIESDEAISHELSHGLAALHLSVIQAVGQISLFMTKHSFIGHTPGPLFIELPKLLNQALFGTALSNKTNFNAYLLTLKSDELRSTLIKFCNFPESVESLVMGKSGNEGPFTQIKLSFEKKDWRLNWSHGEETPELLVPPMEILEQKEVARRFQRLDELILLEDFPAAIRQCKEYLEKNPQSLYLIRRWAFLTLWAGIEFEQKYLDLMAKFDPSNMMTLSLWVRYGLESVNADVLLENLSKLGSSLGSAIVDFDSLDITSLTLPEMLGDAWNQKDDQRAVSCYERVLHARGEIPRILVKLIRLMRDIDDPTAEEAYMDRLLACEVPPRTRAAIYYRLAEIKQKIDPSDASQWALKSWHTNRSQVRYALLAADLLIQLQRPHDAAHVLVETSELIEDGTGEQRLFLEIKIAAIWLEHMQRLDLASERITRALDLIEDETEVYDEIIRLVQKLDDARMLIDVTIRALLLAEKQGDHERSSRYVQVLLDLGDTSDDSKMATDIFTVVLKNSLLGISYTQNLFKREDIDLPFKEIVSAMEARVMLLEAKEQGAYYQLLGDISQDKAEDPERIHFFYERALAGDTMTTRSFDFLDSYYSRMGMNGERFALLQKKLTHAVGGERAVLLRELYYFDEDVLDKDKDSYALQILSTDLDDVGPIEERLAVYEQNHDGEAILNLMNQLKAHDIAPTVMSNLIRSALTFVREMQHENRHLWLIQLLGKLRELGEDQVELARLTVQYLWDAEEKNWVRGPLALLIGRGEIPEIQAGEMLAVIEDDSLKVDLLLLLADRRSDFEEILAYEREALRLTREMPGMMSIKLEIQHRLVAKSEFTVPELEQFLKECRSMGRDSQSLQDLTSQLKLSTHQDHKAFVYERILADIIQHPVEGEDSKLLLATIAELPLADTVKLRLTWLDRFGIQESIHDEFLLDFVLSDAAYWANRELILRLMEHVLMHGAGALDPKVTINNFICRLMTERREEILRDFIDQDLIVRVMDARTAKTATEYSLQNRDGISFQHFWWQSLLRLEERQETIEFLQYSRKAFGQLEMIDNFFGRLGEIAEQESSLVNPLVLFELKLFYADFLIETNSGSKKSRLLLESLYNERPQESRVWGGLIALYRETQAEIALYDILGKVLPSLKEDPRPLKEYQLSVIGLELEYNELSARRDSLRDGPVEVVSMPHFESQPVEFDSSDMFTSPQAMAERTAFSTGLDKDVHTHVAGSTYSADEPFSLDDDVPGRTVLSPSRFELPLAPTSFDISDVSMNVERPHLGGAAVSLDDEDEQPEGVDVERMFAFTEDSQQFTAGTHNRPPSHLPMHTQVAEMPNIDNQFRLDVTGTEPRAYKPTDSVSLYENTNVFTPMAELPPPPPLAGLKLDDDEEDQGPAEPFQAEAPGKPAPVEVAKKREDLSGSWKRVAKTHTSDPGLLQDLLSHPLADQAEQIIAVQAAALIEDKIAQLDHFSHRVWRDPQAIRFELKWSDRMDREMFHPGIKSPLARLLKALYPLFIQAFAHEMGLSGVADRLKMRPDEIQKVRKPVDLNDEVIQRTNLRYYTAALKDNGYHIYHLPSIGDRFQFDFEKRDIYIDRNHYMAAPPSHIFHRLAFLLRAVNLDYFPFLHLSPGGEIFPFLMKCKRSLDQNDGVKRVLGMEKDPLRAMLAQAKDRDYLAQLFGELGNLSADRISQTISNFIEQIYRLNLAETLDLIGVIETISGVDLCNPRASSYQRINQSSSSKAILAFAADLKLSGKQ